MLPAPLTVQIPNNSSDNPTSRTPLAQRTLHDHSSPNNSNGQTPSSPPSQRSHVPDSRPPLARPTADITHRCRNGSSTTRRSSPIQTSRPPGSHVYKTATTGANIGERELRRNSPTFSHCATPAAEGEEQAGPRTAAGSEAAGVGRSGVVPHLNQRRQIPRAQGMRAMCSARRWRGG